MNSRDLANINSSVATLVKKAMVRGDRRPAPILVEEILTASGFDEIDGRRQVASLKRRASAARKAARAAIAEACFT